VADPDGGWPSPFGGRGSVTVDIERREVATGSGPVTTFELGEGPVVGFLHGPAGLDEPTACMRDLAVDHRVVAPCLPGFGPTPGDPTLRTVHDWVVFLSELTDRLGLVGSRWVASSVSAMLALELAAVRPEAFRSLVAVAPTGLWDPDDPGVDLYSLSLTDQEAHLVADEEVRTALATLPEGLDADGLVELGVSRYVRRRTAASLVWPLPDHGLADRLHRVVAKVVLVWGAEDRIVPPSYGERFADLLPTATVVPPIVGAAHLVALDAPAAVAAIVRDDSG